ncbi:MAG: ATP-binding cassette domain-containing protein [Thermomicrobiales bacterium]|nr:ATP-binding cassette domain-containing protein [Thermomicrobiales bacterium]
MNRSIVDVDHLTFAWPEATQPTLHELDWHIEQGSFALLIGRSGSGKSTLLRSLNGLVPHFSGGVFGGNVLVNGLNTRQHAPRDFAHHVGFVFQDPEAQLLTSRVVDDIALGMEQQGVAPSIMRKRVEEMLDLVGVAHLRDRSPETLSGGEKQRVAIAAALAMHPPVLVLDEPTSQLDPWGAEEVIAALQRMNDDLDLTVVISEHRLERVLSHADTVRLLDDDGRPTDGSPVEIARIVSPIALPPIARLARALEMEDIPLTVKQARSLSGFSEVGNQLVDQTPELIGNEPGDVVLRVSNLTVRLERTTVLRDASFDLHQGEFVALLGRNGSGKTTLLRSIMGFVPSSAGSAAMVAGDNRIGYVPQRSASLFFCETLGDELRFTAKKRGVEIDIAARLAEVDLEWAIDRHPSALSVGERQRAAIATVLAGDPQLLLLDEPTRGMDPWHKRKLADVLRRLQQRGVAIIMATHDVELAAELAHTVIMLGDGGIVSMGRPDQVLVDSLTYSTQLNKVLGGQWLTVDQVLRATGVAE